MVSKRMQLVAGIVAVAGVVAAVIGLTQKKKSTKEKESSGVDFKIENWY